MCGKRNEETGDGDKINCAGNLKSFSGSIRTKPGGFIGRKAAVMRDGRVIKHLHLPQSSLLTRAPALAFQGRAAGTRMSSMSPSWPGLAALLPAPGAWHLRFGGLLEAVKRRC